MLQARAQQIVTDGRTNTSVTVNGSVTDVTTKTIQNGNAYNSFSKFDVHSGNTVNLYVPGQADRLVNIVRDKQTDINGILNTYKNGEIGGDVYFLNPHGIVVGKDGVVNTGRLTLQTPTSEFTEELLNGQGAISHAKVDAMLRGDVPLSANGSVRILGEVNARDKLIIHSATQQLTGTVREGAEASRAIFENVVNTDGVTKGATSVAVNADGTISLLGAGQSRSRKMIVVDTSAETRTETALTVREGYVDITTNTINGNNAYNSFSIFDVYEGQTVNLIVPTSVDNLVNVVHDKQSDINGQLNALKDGQIGGNVFFLNPHGIVVGASGIIRADAVTLATPSSEDVDNLLKAGKAPDQNDALALLNLGALQKNSKGIVNVGGLVEAKSGITLAGKDVEISGKLTVEGTGAAGMAPQIIVHSVENTVINGGQILAEGSDGRDGGTVDVHAGNDVTLTAGSLISVSGKGEDSDAGSATIFAENEATLGLDASVLAMGGEISGDGGFIEFSGRKIANLAGGRLDAAAIFGAGGEVLIDPEDIVISANTCLGCGGGYSGALSAGAAFRLEASNSITLAENVFLSTRQVGGATDRASHESGASTGDSGAISLTASEIVMESGSAIFAHATGGYAAGDVDLSGRAITLDAATLTGGDVALKAREDLTDTASVVLQVGEANAEINILNGSRIAADGTLDVEAVARSVVEDLAFNVNRPYLLSSANTAKAAITIDNSSLTATGDVTVEARAETVSLASDLLTDSVLPVPVPIDAAVGVAVSSATVKVTNGSTVESTGGDVDLIADSRAKVEAIGTARNVAFGSSTLPYAAAISVGVVSNKAEVTVDDSVLHAKNDVDVHAYALSENETSFDVFGGSGTRGALGIGVNFTDHSAIARVNDSAVTADTGAISVLTDSLQRASQSGTVSVSDRSADNVIDMIDLLVAGVVGEFFTEDGTIDETGQTIEEYWGVTRDAAKDVDTLAAAYSDAWGSQSGISGGGGGSVWGAAGGALIALSDTKAEITGESTIDAAGTLRVESRANSSTTNTVATDVTYNGSSGTATALALNLSYEDIANRAAISGDAIGALAVDAGAVSVLAGQMEETEVAEDDVRVTFRGEELNAQLFANGRSIIANARATASSAVGNTYAIGVGVSTRNVSATIDNAALTAAPGGAISVIADNELATLYMESGDNSDMAVLSVKAAEKRLTDQLAKIQVAKQQAKADAQQRKATATTAAERAAADRDIAAADSVLNKVSTQQTKVADTTSAAQAKTDNPVASLGSSYTIGFNFLDQNTSAVLGGGATVAPASGALGAVDVLATSGVAAGGLSTFAALNGGSSGSQASSGNALNIGVNVLFGETKAAIEATGGANELRSGADVSVKAANATNFTILNESRTPTKVKADASAANLITLSGGVQMLDTEASLARNIHAGGNLTVEAASANTISTILYASTAGGAVAPASNAITSGIDLFEDIAGYGGEDEAGTGEEGDSTASLGIGAIFDVGFLAAAIGNAGKLKQAADQAMAAEADAQKVMKDQGKKDFVLSAGFSYNSFDSVAQTADNLVLEADGMTVAAYNDTDASVDVTADSEFEEGAGATVLSVAANLANQDNRALIGKGSTIVLGAGGLTVDASTKAWVTDENGVTTLREGSSDFLARSTGTSELKGDQVILALGLNIVDFENEAAVGDDVTILSRDAYNATTQAGFDAALATAGVNPNVTVTSLGVTTLKAEGNAANGTNGLFFAAEDGQLTYYNQSRQTRGQSLGFGAADMAGAVIGGYLDTKARRREAELTTPPPAGGEGNAKGFGIGINIGAIDVHAGIGNNNAIADIGALAVLTDARVRSSALGVAGSGPSTEILSLSPNASASAATAMDAAAGINVVYGDVSATIGTGRAATVRTGVATDAHADVQDLKVAAKTQAMAEAYADGKAAGAQAADGMAGALNLHDFDTTATLAASVRASGDVTVDATADTVEIVKAEASARGTPVEDYAAKLKTSINSLLVGSGGGNPNSGFFGQAADRFSSTYDEISKSTDAFSQTKSSQSFAAAMGFNFADHDTKAVISDGVVVEADGAIDVIADHDAMSMVAASGAAVLSDKATGAAIGGNLILTDVGVSIGDNVVLGSSAHKADSVSVQATSRFNTGANVDDLLRYKVDDDGNPILEGGEKVLDEALPSITYATEAIAGAGGKGSSMAGAIATTIYLGDTAVDLGDDVSVATTGDATIAAYDRSQLANKGWGVSAALGGGTSVSKSARGAVGSVIYRGRSVTTTIGDDFTLDADGDATIAAKVLKPSDAWVGRGADSAIASTTWKDYVEPLLAGDIAAPLRNADPAVTQSLHNQVIAVAAAGQSTSASFSGALGLTVANGETKVVIGENADVSARTIDVSSTMSQEVLGVGGSLTVSLTGSGGTYGAQAAVNVVLDDVLTEIGDGGTFVATGDDVTVEAAADTQAMSITAVASLSGSASSTVAANLSSNTFASSATANIRNNVDITAAGNVSIDASNAIDAFAFAGALGVSFGPNSPVAATIVSNTQISSAEALIGAGSTVTANAGDIDVAATTDEDLLSIPVAGGGLTGILSVTVVDSTTRAVADATSTLNALNGDVAVTAENSSDILEVAGALAFSTSGAALGLTMPGTGVSKTVEAQIGNAYAKNIEVAARARNDIRQLAAAGAASTSSVGASGTVGVLVVDNAITARIAANATVVANGNVWVDAADDSAMLQFGGGIGAGSSVGVGASAATLVVLGETLAEVGANADVTARGLEDDVVTVVEHDEVGDAEEAERTGIVNNFELLEQTGTGFADDVEAAFDALADIGQSGGVRDSLLANPTSTHDAKGFVMTANGDHRAVAISLAVGAATGAAGVGGVVDVGVFNNTVGAHVRQGANINAAMSAANLAGYGATQDAYISAQSVNRVVGFAGMVGAGSTAGVGGGATVNVFKGTTASSVEDGATVKARRDVTVTARRAQDIGLGNFAMGGGGTAGIGAAVNVTVIGGSTSARVDGRADGYRNVDVSAFEDSSNLEVVGAIGVAGTAGVGGAVNVLVASSTVAATLGASGSINAMGDTAITARAAEEIGNIIVSGGAGGVAGVGASINVVDSRRGVSAFAYGDINQAAGFNPAGGNQDVTVEADSSIDMYRLVGGLGGGGTVGVGASFDMATILNQTDAGIGGGARVFAGGTVTVDAASAKNYASNTIAGGVGGVVGVGGAVVINRTGYGNLNDYEGSDGSSAVDGGGVMGDVDGLIDTIKSHEIAASGDATLDATVSKANAAAADGLGGSGTSVTALLTQEGHDRTTATVGDGAVITAGADLDVVANDWDRVYQLAGSVGGGGAVGVGLTVGVNDFASNAVASIGNNALIQVGQTMTMTAQNIAVLEAVNFAGAGGGVVGVAGSINYNRLTTTASATLGANAKVSADAALIRATNEQNMAATTVGLAGGFVGAGVSFTHAELGGGATTTIASGAEVETTSGDLDVEAIQNARLSVDGLAGAGGAIAGQAAVSEIREDSDAAVVLGDNVTLDAAGDLSILAENDAWSVSNVVGIAFGAVAAGYVHSYSDSFGDATVTIGNNHDLTGATVDINAVIGELQDAGRLSGALTLATVAGDRSAVQTALSYLGLGRSTYHRSETFALAAAGGLGAAQGSNLGSETDNDAVVTMGTGQVTSTAGDVTIAATNEATLKSKVIGLTVGAVSLGAHVASSKNYNDASVTIGSHIVSAEDIAILAANQTKATADSFAISGGVVSAGVSRASIVDKGGATVVLSDALSKASGDDIKALGDITIVANNDRRFDGKMDSFGVGVYGGGSGRTSYDVEGTANVSIGDKRKIVAKIADEESNGEDIDIVARNAIAKDLFSGTNLDLKAYGAIAVADVDSDVSVKTDTGVTIGDAAEIYSADTLSVKSMTDVSGDDSINVDAAGAGAAATGKSNFTHTGISGERAKSTVTVGANAALFAGEHLELAAVTDTYMATSGEGTAYGAGATLRVDSITKSVSDNLVTINDGATVASFGDVFLGAGEDYVAPDDTSASEGDRTFGYRINSNDVSSKVISIIGAAIGIPRDNISRATSDQTNTLNIANGASVQSGGNIHAAASDNARGGAIAYIDVRNNSATSFLTAFMNIKGVGKTIKSGTVNLDGTLETGIDRVRSIEIDGSDMSSVTGSGYNWRKAVTKNGDTWEVDYEAPLGDVILRTGSENGGLTGSGKIITPRDADLRVVNNSTLDLSIKGLNIPYLVGGKVYVNGTEIKQNGSSLLGSVDYTLPTERSAITVLNVNAAAPDLTIDGRVSNLGGSVTLANIYGSIEVRDRVQAAELAILAGKDFRINSDEDINLGNDPIAEFEDVADSYNNVQTSTDSNQTASGLTPQGAQGSIEALGNIYIKADGVNINGLIRSGVSGRDNTVTQAMVDKALADAQKDRYAATGSEDDRYIQINDPLGFDPLTATREELDSLSIDDLAEIPLFYDYATGRIVAKDLQAEGGTIVIEGRIASTGRGSVQALDGFARFDITNETATAIELRNIDTGDGVEGSIIFNDHNYGSGDAYLQTRWARIGNDMIKYQDMSDELTDGRATTVVATGAAAGTYDPLNGQRYQWTVEADYYDLREFKSFHEDKDDGEEGVNKVFNAHDGKTWAEVDYDWVRNELSSGDWYDYGDEHKEWSAPTYGDDPIGSLILDPSDDSEFRYVRDVTELYREIENFESETICETEIIICLDYLVKPKMDFRVYYHSEQTYSVEADKTINVGFFGEDTGRISVDSQGDVVIGGTVRNISGETNLTSHQGGIYSAEDGVLVANNITLNAATTIGASLADTFRIEQYGTNAIVNASAPNIYLEETQGNLRVGQITVDAAKTASGGDLALIAKGDIDLTPSNMGSVVTAGQIHLESETGEILTNNAANGLDVDTDADGGGTLTVLSKGTDDLTLREVAGDLRVDTVEYDGALTLLVQGDLLDGHDDTIDLSELDDGFAQFLDDQGIGTDAYNESETALVNDAKADQMTAMYHAYWQMRAEEGGDEGGADAGANSLFAGFMAPKEAEGQTFAAYDPNFEFHVSDTDRQALLTNGYSETDITDYEAQQTAFYHDAHTKLGSAATGSYDANFAYVLSDAEKAANTEGLTFDRSAVLNAVNAEVVGGNAQNSKQSSNIRAGGLNINVSGSIGEEAPSFTVNAGGGGTVSPADMQRMRTAEAGEVQFLPDGSIVVTDRRGVSINATDTVTVQATNDAFLESQGDLNVNTITAGNSVQLKVSGSLLNANTSGGANVTGRNLVLTSAGEQFGTADNRFITETSEDGFLQLRTGGAAFIEEKTGDMRLQDASGPTLDLIANDGRIIDAFNDSGKEINGDNVRLYARDGIGSADNALDVTTRVGGSIEVETPGDSYMYAPDIPVRVKQATVGGISRIVSASQILVEAGKTFSAYSLDWYAPQDIVFEQNSKVIARSGTALIRTDANFTMQKGSTIDAGFNAIDIGAKGNVVLGNLVSQRGGDGAVVVNAGGSINGNGDNLLDIDLSDPTALASLTAHGGIGGDRSLVTNLSRLELTNTDGGDVVVENKRSMTLESAEVGAGSGIHVETLGDLFARNVVGVDGDIELEAENDLTEDENGQIDAGVGNIDIVAGNDATLTTVRTGGEGDIAVQAMAGRIDLTNGLSTAEGDIAVNAYTDLELGALGNVTAAGAGNVSLGATTGTITQNVAAIVNGGTGNIDLTAGVDALLTRILTGGEGDIMVAALTGLVDLNDEISTEEGNVSVTANTDLTLFELGNVTAAGRGNVRLQAETGDYTQDVAAVVDAGTGNAHIWAGNDAFVQTVQTAGDGNIGIRSLGSNVHLQNLIHTAEGSIGVSALHNLYVTQSSNIRADGNGHISLTAVEDDFVQQQGSWIDGGYGLVRIHGGYNVTMRDVRTRNTSRFRIVATAGNHVDDGGNYHRNDAETRVNSTIRDRETADLVVVPTPERYLEGLRTVIRSGSSIVRMPTQPPVDDLWTTGAGTIVLGSRN